MTNFSIDVYTKKVSLSLRLNPHQRYGQTLFNVLNDNWPHIANEIRGTEYDPFYMELEEDRNKFWCYLIDNETQFINYQPPIVIKTDIRNSKKKQKRGL